MTQVYYHLDEAAGIARCSTKTIQRAIHCRKLTAYRPGRRLVIKKTDFDAWLRSTVVVPCVDPRVQQSAVVRMIRKGGSL